MELKEVQQAINQANEQLRQADDAAGRMASILTGRLRQVPSYTLKKLKRELARFNGHTGNWND